MSQPEAAQRREDLQAKDHNAAVNVSNGDDSQGVVPLDRRGHQTHQRLVFTDPVAFRYLEEDPSTVILERRRELTGYEVYLVEQWACSRAHPTFIITTFTGLPHHTALVGVLSVPTDEEAWSPRLRVYLKAISKFHARKQETPLGTLMVTNLSGFPSALTVIPVPGGDVRRFKDEFIVNEDLKRLGCSGRAGLNLAVPTAATQSKFLQLYRTSDRVPLTTAVMELVKLCQVALVLFDQLAPEFADGLLCDVTERAIGNWWTEVGMEYFNVEPNDGVLGPTTVTAILGLLLGARNRLNAYGAPMPKDVFDLPTTKRGIAYFQKAQKDLPKTRRLDRLTLERLHRMTSKAAANHEGWTVPRAVKSTVAELGGKGGEMVMEMVGAKDKTGIAEVETLDIATFIDVLSGERCKWLWHGKPMKNAGSGALKTLGAEEEIVFSGDEQAGYQWTRRRRDSTSDQGGLVSHLNHLYTHPTQGSQTSLEPSDRDQAFHKNVLKSVTGRMSDARTGLGRFKDAVGIHGLRGHHHRYSRDDGQESESLNRTTTQDYHSGRDLHVPTPKSADSAPPSELDLPYIDHQRDASVTSDKKRQAFPGVTLPVSGSTTDPGNMSDNPEQESKLRTSVRATAESPHAAEVSDASSHRQSQPTDMPRLRGPQGGTTEIPAINQRAYRGAHQEDLSIVRRSQSLPLPRNIDTSHGDAWKREIARGRQLSFSVIDDILRMERCSAYDDAQDALDDTDVEKCLALEIRLAIKAEGIHRNLLLLESMDLPWLKKNIGKIEQLDDALAQDKIQLEDAYQQKLEETTALRDSMNDLVSEEKASVLDALKEIENLGAKLDYEVNALRSKIDDVEDGVTDYELQALKLEHRSHELEHGQTNKLSWIGRLGHLLSGSR